MKTLYKLIILTFCISLSFSVQANTSTSHIKRHCAKGKCAKTKCTKGKCKKPQYAQFIDAQSDNTPSSSAQANTTQKNSKSFSSTPFTSAQINGSQGNMVQGNSTQAYTNQPNNGNGNNSHHAHNGHHSHNRHHTNNNHHNPVRPHPAPNPMPNPAHNPAGNLIRTHIATLDNIGDSTEDITITPINGDANGGEGVTTLELKAHQEALVRTLDQLSNLKEVDKKNGEEKDETIREGRSYTFSPSATNETGRLICSSITPGDLGLLGDYDCKV